MSYLSTQKRLVGKYVVTQHAVRKMKQRYGDEYIGNAKIKNLNKNKVKRKIRKTLREDIKFVSEQDDGAVYVRTEHFSAIVVPEFNNKVVTILDH